MLWISRIYVTSVAVEGRIIGALTFKGTKRRNISNWWRAGSLLSTRCVTSGDLYDIGMVILHIYIFSVFFVHKVVPEAIVFAWFISEPLDSVAVPSLDFATISQTPANMSVCVT